MKPEPNFQTVASLQSLIVWLGHLHQGAWSWIRNSRCKYVTIRIDTRHGVHSIQDRDGNEITLEQLCYQLGVDEQEKLS